MLHGGRELRHQHGKTAVADDGDGLAPRMGELGGDGEGHARSHRVQHPGIIRPPPIDSKSVPWFAPARHKSRAALPTIVRR
jgi:hypothetical protein